MSLNVHTHEVRVGSKWISRKVLTFCSRNEVQTRSLPAETENLEHTPPHTCHHHSLEIGLWVFESVQENDC